jgi:chromosome segregation ATPase
MVEAELNLKRAAAAVAEEQRETDKARYRTAKEEGRALAAEYDAVRQRFAVLDAEIQRKAIPFAQVNNAIQAHIASEPELVEDFASEEQEEAWVARGEELKADHAGLAEEIRELYGRREASRLEAVKLGQRIDHHRYVVKNLKMRIIDPKGDYAKYGWQGGVAPPV